VKRMHSSLFNRLLQKIAAITPGGGTIRPWLHRVRGAKIGKNVWISQFVYIDELHPEKISIDENCTIGLRTSIFSHFYWGPKKSNVENGSVIIEKNVFIGPHCVILPNVRIGEGSVIKAGTVLTKDVPPNTFFGSPSGIELARVTVPLTSEHTYEEFVKGLRPIRRGKPDQRDR